MTAGYRLLNFIDYYNCEGFGIEVELSLPSLRVARALDQIVEWRGRPRMVGYDKGPEDISEALAEWARC